MTEENKGVFTDPTTGEVVDLGNSGSTSEVESGEVVGAVEEVTALPERHPHYIGGRKVLITNEELEKFLNLQKEVEEAQGGALLSEIPANHVYHDKKKELDSFVAGLRS